MRKKKNTFSGLAFKSMNTNTVFFPRSRIYKRRHHRVFFISFELNMNSPIRCRNEEKF